MKRIIIGGVTRHVGKTMLAETLVRAVQPERWAAVKVTVIEDDDEVISHLGDDIHAARFLATGYVIVTDEVIVKRPSSDTGRLAAVGAWPVLWLVARPERLMAAWTDAEQHITGVAGVVVESSRLALLLAADLVFCVIGADVPPSRWKTHARDLIAGADVVILRSSSERGDLSARLRADIERWRQGRPLIVCDAMTHAVRHPDVEQRLIALQAHSE